MSRVTLVKKTTDEASAVHLVANLLETYQERFPGRPLVAVFDVDDTLLTEYDSEISFVSKHPVVQLFRMVSEMKDAFVFVVTARTPDGRDYTLCQLAHIGVVLPPERLFLCPDNMREEGFAGVATFKAHVRSRLAEMFKTPVTVTVGDQFTDIVDLASREEREAIYEKLKIERRHHAVVRPNDGGSVWGLKLAEPEDDGLG